MITVGQAGRYIVANARTFGITSSLSDALYLGTRHLVDVRILRALLAVQADVSPALLPSGEFSARWATEAELREAARSPEWQLEMTQASIDQHLTRGEECFAVFHRGVIVTLAWYARKPVPVTSEMTMHFDPEWVYVHRAHTVPAYRGLHLNGAAMTAALLYCVSQGARGLLAFVEFNNLRSLRSMTAQDSVSSDPSI